MSVRTHHLAKIATTTTTMRVLTWFGRVVVNDGTLSAAVAVVNDTNTIAVAALDASSLELGLFPFLID